VNKIIQYSFSIYLRTGKMSVSLGAQWHISIPPKKKLKLICS